MTDPSSGQDARTTGTGRRPLTVSVVQTRPHPSTDRYREAITRGVPERGVSVIQSIPRRAPHVPLPGARRAAEYLRRWIQQPAQTRRTQADVFHLLDDNGPVTRVLAPDRTIVTCHDLILLLAAEHAIPYDGPRWYIHRFRHGVGYLRRVAAVVCPTEAVRHDIVRLCDVEPARVHAIPHGIDAHFTRLTPERRRELRAGLGTGGGHVILHVGTGGFYKNVPATLSTLSALRRSGLDVALVRVGHALTEEERAERDRLGLGSAILDLGRVSEERLVEIYNAADVLLFPSLAEGFGWPVLESMACGTPVVAADIPALREVGGDAILYAPAREPRQLAEAVRALLIDPERRAGAVEQVQRRAGRFDWATALDAYVGLYREVAAAAGPRT